jgi:hypothetical protein
MPATCSSLCTQVPVSGTSGLLVRLVDQEHLTFSA